MDAPVSLLTGVCPCTASCFARHVLKTDSSTRYFRKKAMQFPWHRSKRQLPWSDLDPRVIRNRSVPIDFCRNEFMAPFRLLFEPLLLDEEGRALARVADLTTYSAMLFARRGRFTAGETATGWLQSPPHGGVDDVLVRLSFSVLWTSRQNMGGWSSLSCSVGTLDDLSYTRLKRML